MLIINSFVITNLHNTQIEEVEHCNLPVYCNSYKTTKQALITLNILKITSCFQQSKYRIFVYFKWRKLYT